MMGAGKTSVGKALALRLQRPFHDTDAEVEQAAGASVAEIFAREGEPAFRERERGAVAELLEGRAVVALGGGAMAQPETRALIRRRGTSVYLRATAETLLARVGDAEARPLLAGLDDGERIARLRALLEERAPAYACADRVVDTDGCSLEVVVETIVEELGEAA